MNPAVAGGSELEPLRLDARDLGAADHAAWSDLAGRAAEPNPFYRPEFVLANVIERGLSVELLVVRQDTRWLACLPVQTRPPSLPLPMPSLGALIDEYTFCSTPLLDRDLLGPAADAFIDLVLAEHRYGVLMLEMFAPDGPVGAALAGAAARKGMQPIVISDRERPAWRRSDVGLSPGAVLTRSDRRSIARLSSAVRGELDLVDRSAEPGAWEAFLAMERSGWKGDQGTAMGSKSTDAAFFRRMCAGMSAAGRLEVLALEAAGRAIAMKCQLIDGDVVYSFKIAHDPLYRKYSPGTQLLQRVMERFDERGIVLADSCASSQNVHMNRVWPGRRRVQTLLLPTGAHRARLLPPALGAVALARRVKRSVVRHRPTTPVRTATR
jgi:hypothetical protein